MISIDMKKFKEWHEETKRRSGGIIMSRLIIKEKEKKRMNDKAVGMMWALKVVQDHCRGFLNDSKCVDNPCNRCPIQEWCDKLDAYSQPEDWEFPEYDDFKMGDKVRRKGDQEPTKAFWEVIHIHHSIDGIEYGLYNKQAETEIYHIPWSEIEYPVELKIEDAKFRLGDIVNVNYHQPNFRYKVVDRKVHNGEFAYRLGTVVLSGSIEVAWVLEHDLSLADALYKVGSVVRLKESSNYQDHELKIVYVFWNKSSRCWGYILDNDQLNCPLQTIESEIDKVVK